MLAKTKKTLLTLLILLTNTIKTQKSPKQVENARIMADHLSKKKYISNEDHKKIINEFSVDPNSEEAQDLAELTRKNIEFLQEHYKNENVEILPPKYQYFNKNKNGNIVPVENFNQIKKAFEKKKKRDFETEVIRSKSNRSVEIGEDLLKKSEKMNLLTNPDFMKKNKFGDDKNLNLGNKNNLNLGGNLTLSKKLENSKFNLSPELLKKELNFKSVAKIKKNNLLSKKPQKKIEYNFIPQNKNFNFGIENDLNLSKIDQKILKSTLQQQNTDFFKDHKIKKGNYVNFKKIDEKDYLKSVEKNEQLKLIDQENESAIAMTNRLIEEEIKRAMEGKDYKPSNDIPSLITGSEDFNERLMKLQAKDRGEIESDKNLFKKKKNSEKKKNLGENENLRNEKFLGISNDKLLENNLLLKKSYKEDDKILQRELELLNQNFEAELALIEKQMKNRLDEISNSKEIKKKGKENLLLEKEKIFQNELFENRKKKEIEIEKKLFLEKKKIENLKKNEIEIEKKMRLEFEKSEILKKREKEILDWRINMEEQKKKLEKQKIENLRRKAEIEKLLQKKKNYENSKNLNNEISQNFEENIEKKIKNLKLKKTEMENELKKTNDLLMNNDKKLSTEDMKFFMEKIQNQISEIRKIKLNLEENENLQKKNQNRIFLKIEKKKKF